MPHFVLDLTSDRDMKTLSTLILTLLLWATPVLAQELSIDSLNALGQTLRMSNPEAAITSAKKALSMADSLGYTEGTVQALIHLGYVFVRIGDYDLAEGYLKRAVELGGPQPAGDALRDLSFIERLRGNYPEAMDYALQALRRHEGQGDPAREAQALAEIGKVHNSMQDLDKALAQYDAALEVYTEAGMADCLTCPGYANLLNHIGVLRLSQGSSDDEPLSYFRRAFEGYEEIGDILGQASALGNMGVTYHYREDYEQARTYYERSLVAKETIGDSAGVAVGVFNVGAVYQAQGRIREAIPYGKRSLELARALGDKFMITRSAWLLHESYEVLGEYEEAYRYRDLRAAYQDSLFNESKSEEIGRLQAQYQFEKEAEAQTQIRQRREIIVLSGLGILLLVVVAGAFNMRTLKAKNRIIEERTLELSKLSRAVEQSPASVMITDVNGTIEYVNPKFVDLTGYGLEEAIGANPSVLKSPETPRETYEDLWKTISSGNIWSGEFKNLKKNGESYWEFASIAPVRNEAGEITNYVAVKEDITERKEAEKRLQEREERFRTVFEAPDDAIFYFSQAGIIDCNAAAVRVFGATEKSQIVGLQPYDIVISPEFQPDGRPSGEAGPDNIKIAVSQGRHRFEWLHRRLDGSLFPVEVSMTPVQLDGSPAILALLRDLTERKEHEREIEEARNQLDAVFQNCPQGLILFSSSGVIVNCNDRLVELMGYTREEWIGYNTLKDASDLGVRAALGKAINGEWVDAEGTYPSPTGGKTIDLRTVYNPINPNDTPTEVIASIEDITLRKEAEVAILEAKKAADAANAAKSTFLANMSHEIRTPMNAILGFTELLDERITDAQDRQYLQYVQSSGKSLLTLINDILDLSKVEAGKLSIQPEAVDAKQLFGEMQHVFSHKVETKGIDFITEVDQSLPGALVLDDVRVRQVLINLLGNAVKFTETGHVKLAVTGEYPDGDGSTLDLIIEVEDTGIGIPEDQLEKVFGAFEQTAGQSTAKYGGTGLGLAITKKLIELMNGEVSIESEVGTGSVFRVVLHDVAVAAVDLSADSDLDGFDASAVTFKPATIALADDIAVNRALVKGFLSNYDLDIIEAANGEELVDKARTQHPDLILTDMKMPVMDGYEATEILKGDDETANIPVIALTASVMEQSVETIKEMCDGYLAKPVSKAGLVQELMRHLDHEVEEREEVEALSVEESASLTPETMEKLPKLLETLESSRAQCEALRESQMINDIEAFGTSMKTMGDEFGFHPLEKWGSQLEMQSQMFDLDAMNRTLEGFGAMVETIREHTHKLDE